MFSYDPILLKDKAPLLVNTGIKSFELYLDSLAKDNRKTCRKVFQKNKDLEYKPIPIDLQLIQQFMELWERQTVFGGYCKWFFGIEYLEFLHSQNKLLCFQVCPKEQDTILALHFLEKHNQYVLSHPPMYEKEQFLERSMARFSMFSFIKWAIEQPEIEWFDIGGSGKHWRDLLQTRDKYSRLTHKWIYVPKALKENPDLAPPYLVKTESFTYRKYLCEVETPNVSNYK